MTEVDRPSPPSVDRHGDVANGAELHLEPTARKEGVHERLRIGEPPRGREFLAGRDVEHVQSEPPMQRPVEPSVVVRAKAIGAGRRACRMRRPLPSVRQLFAHPAQDLRKDNRVA